MCAENKKSKTGGQVAPDAAASMATAGTRLGIINTHPKLTFVNP